jgi:hypothetical protein
MPQIRRLRALSLLATSADGRTEARLLARGEEISGLIRDGLATASTVRVGRTPVEVVRIKITEAGRAALAPGDRSSSWKLRTTRLGRAILPRRAPVTGRAR